MCTSFVLQVNGAGACGSVLPAPYRGIRDVCTRVFQEGGVRGLYRGICKRSLKYSWSLFSATFVFISGGYALTLYYGTSVLILPDLVGEEIINPYGLLFWIMCRSHTMGHTTVCRVEVLCLRNNERTLA